MKTQSTNTNQTINQNTLNKTERKKFMCTQKTTNLIKKLKRNFFLFFVFFPLLLTLQTAHAQVNPSWAMQYDNGGYWDQAYHIAVHQNGDVYVTGESRSPSSPNVPDIATVKYYSNGVQAVGWPKRWQNPNFQNSVDVALGITIDAQENVYITGFTQQAGGNFDIVTLKYNTDGNLLATAFYNGTGNGFDIGNTIWVDDNGMVYIAGFSMGAGSGEDGILIKYNNALQEQWVARFNGLSNGTDRFYGMSVRASTDIYVTGMTQTNNGKTDFVTIKYNTFSSAPVWTPKTYNGPMNDSDWSFSVFNDPVNGGVVVTGPSMGDGSEMDYATIKYYADGTTAWTKRAGSFFNDRPNRITADRFGNVIVTGYSMNNGGNYDCLTMKYDPQGNDLWGQNGQRFNNGYNDISNFVATDYDGNVYITGKTFIPSRGYDAMTVKYGFNGTQVWLGTYGYSENLNDEGAAIGIDGNNNVYVAGFVNQTGQADYVTLKYPQGLVGINNNTESAKEFKLEQNFPNPFNPSTQIGFEIPKESNVKIIVYDNLGRQLETLVNQKLHAGKYSIEWYASKYSSGVYFYKIDAGEFTQTRKMLLVK